MLMKIWTAKYLFNTSADTPEKLAATALWLLGITFSYLLYALLYGLISGFIK